MSVSYSFCWTLMKKPSKQISNAVVVLIGMLLVGYLDYITGNEIRIFPLYFLPLARAAIVFGKRGAIVASLIATTIWLLSQYFSGREYSHEYIWAINFLTQGAAFLLVTFLMASLRTALGRERELSRTDALTGLLNSRALHEIAGAELTLCHRSKRPAVMAFIDLDNFKNVNDNHGHDRGDSLLRHVAKVLMSSLRSSDVVARIGGDEFAIFLPETDADQARSILEEMHVQLHQLADFKNLQVGASIGAVAYATSPPNLLDMIQEADAHMYTVKTTGKNRVNVKPASTFGGSDNK